MRRVEVRGMKTHEGVYTRVGDRMVLALVWVTDERYVSLGPFFKAYGEKLAVEYRCLPRVQDQS